MNYDKDLSKSAKAFEDHVAPLLKRKLKLEKIIACEDKQNDAERVLDYNACIDYLISRGEHVSGLASRVSFKPEYKDKLTLRKARSNGRPTEYQKLEDAIDAGIYPKIFCAACVVDDELVSCAVVQTIDLLNFIDRYKPPIKTNFDRDKKQSQAYFVVDLLEMEQLKYPVHFLTDN